MGDPSAGARHLVLTPRQSEILSLVAVGFSDKQIAERLGVSPRTVRTHLERLFHEYGFSSRSAAVAAWLRAKHNRQRGYNGTRRPGPAPALGVG
jgi:DNA-binding CsgD family transcriptional regulator